ncbi:MAG TPA: permease prefix domain 1-containing protein [Terriglobia bacterium]|nr:permease prefix domain 1-containing protein [Terriglobia bacterium]
MRFHLENQIKEKISQGMSPEEARYAALRELGGVEQIKEECRDMRGALARGPPLSCSPCGTLH